MSMCSSCSWIVSRSGSSSAAASLVDGPSGGGNSGCDVVAAVFGLASGVCSVATLLLPIPHDRAPQVTLPSSWPSAVLDRHPCNAAIGFS
jgi:hypothetical protein